MYYAGLRPEDSRIVPVHPELTTLLCDHLAHFGTAPDGRMFSGVRGGKLPTITYRRAWIKARQTARLDALLMGKRGQVNASSNNRSHATFAPMNTKIVSSTASTRTGVASTPSPLTMLGAIASIPITA